MGLFQRLFGGSGYDADEDPRAALANAGDDRELRRLGVRRRGDFAHGGPLHAEFRAAAAAVGIAPRTEPDALPLFHWEDLGSPGAAGEPGDPSVQGVGDLDLLLRRSFLLDVLAAGDAGDDLEVIPELSDLAVKRGLMARFVPA